MRTVYGCLYFHVSDQLREFADRLSRFDIFVKAFCMDATNLSDYIKCNGLVDFGIPSTIRFDRIDVSNVVDAEYLGVSRVVGTWGGFLKRREDATMVGYFMNWPAVQTGAEPAYCPRDIVEKLVAEGRVKSHFYDIPHVCSTALVKQIPMPPRSGTQLTEKQAKGVLPLFIRRLDVHLMVRQQRSEDGWPTPTHFVLYTTTLDHLRRISTSKVYILHSLAQNFGAGSNTTLFHTSVPSTSLFDLSLMLASLRTAAWATFGAARIQG